LIFAEVFKRDFFNLRCEKHYLIPMKPILLVFLFILSIFPSSAQQLNLWENSSASGSYAIGSNPAMMADNRMKWMINLSSFSTTLGKNTTNIDFVPLSKRAFKLQNADFRAEKTKLQGPAFMYQMDNGSAIGLGFIHRSYQYQPDFFVNLLKEKTSVISAPFIDANSLAVAVSDLVFSYANPISYGNHTLKSGIDLKFSKLQNFLNSSPSNIQSTGNELTFKAEGLTVGRPGSVSTIIGAGNQISLDLGFVYEYRPLHSNYEYQMDRKKRLDPSLDKHLFRIGYSISDIGNINQEVFAYQNNIVQSLPTVNINSDLATYLKARISPISKGKRALHLPTQSTIFAEVVIGKKGWSLGGMYKSAVKDYYLPLGQENIIAFYPKKVNQNKELAFPIIYSPNQKTIGVGIHLRYGSFMMGTESINGFFMKNSMNPGFYVGLNIGKLAQKLQDKDRDNVSDKIDK
jgi:hypothetical protein